MPFMEVKAYEVTKPGTKVSTRAQASTAEEVLMQKEELKAQRYATFGDCFLPSTRYDLSKTLSYFKVA